MFTEVAVPAGFLYVLCVGLVLDIVGKLLDISRQTPLPHPKWGRGADLILNVVLLTLAVGFLL